MYYIKFFYTVFLFPPGVFILALLLFAWWRRRSRALVRAALAAAAVLYLASIPLVSGPLLRHLESLHTPPANISGDVIIVLGGGATFDTPNLGARGHLSGSSANRLLTGLQLYHRLGVPIIISGGQVYATGGVEAEIARNILRGVGVPDNKIIVEAASLNTGDNARYTAAFLRERGFTRPILVTSAFHMERSVRQFQKQGVAVLPFPTDYQDNIAYRFHYTELWPTAAATAQLGTALKEYIGLAVARWY